MKTLFDYCFYRISKAYRFWDEKDYCGWGYGVLFATFGFIALTLTNFILYTLHYKLTTTIIVIVLLPFIALDGVLSIFLQNKNKKKYKQLEKEYKDEKYSKLKGWLVFLYVICSLTMYFVSLYIFDV
ncbi:MAG: hypothetical protein LBO74_02615 [Candidatus Symbiothrix sp.]|jgi:cobalamin synthase|nr:hypothetical protein [Candidatus Symbiothrix sp.]